MITVRPLGDIECEDASGLPEEKNKCQEHCQEPKITARPLAATKELLAFKLDPASFKVCVRLGGVISERIAPAEPR